MARGGEVWVDTKNHRVKVREVYVARVPAWWQWQQARDWVCLGAATRDRHDRLPYPPRRRREFKGVPGACLQPDVMRRNSTHVGPRRRRRRENDAGRKNGKRSKREAREEGGGRVILLWADVRANMSSSGPALK